MNRCKLGLGAGYRSARSEAAADSHLQLVLDDGQAGSQSRPLRVAQQRWLPSSALQGSSLRKHSLTSEAYCYSSGVKACRQVCLPRKRCRDSAPVSPRS